MSRIPFSFVPSTVGPGLDPCSMRLTFIVYFSFKYFSIFIWCLNHFKFALFTPLTMSNRTVFKNFLTKTCCFTFKPDSFKITSIEQFESALAMRLVIFHITYKLLPIRVLTSASYWFSILPRADKYDSTLRCFLACAVDFIIKPFSFIYVTIQVFICTLAVLLIILKITIINFAVFECYFSLSITFPLNEFTLIVIAVRISKLSKTIRKTFNEFALVFASVGKSYLILLHLYIIY